MSKIFFNCSYLGIVRLAHRLMGQDKEKHGATHLIPLHEFAVARQLMRSKDLLFD